VLWKKITKGCETGENGRARSCSASKAVFFLYLHIKGGAKDISGASFVRLLISFLGALP
jgi:hypothetical protein